MIYEGDFLKFNWTGDVDHTVYQLTTADNYENCNFKSARLWGEKTNVVIGPLIAPKTLYFACSFYGHCDAGQKVAVTVARREFLSWLLDYDTESSLQFPARRVSQGWVRLRLICQALHVLAAKKLAVTCSGGA